MRRLLLVAVLAAAVAAFLDVDPGRCLDLGMLLAFLAWRDLPREPVPRRCGTRLAGVDRGAATDRLGAIVRAIAPQGPLRRVERFHAWRRG